MHVCVCARAYMRVCNVCMCAYVCISVCARMCVWCMRACVYVCMCDDILRNLGQVFSQLKRMTSKENIHVLIVTCTCT